MSDEQEKKLYRITANVKYGVRGQVGDCAVRYTIDGEDKTKLFCTCKQAAEFCVEIGVDNFFVLMPDQRWHSIQIEQDGQAE